VIDPFVLQTLPPRELRCGLAECVKHGVIRDATLFDFIADNLPKIQALDPGTMIELIRRNVEIKAAVVMADEKEAGERAHLNFGHTFAHAIEANAGFGAMGHGEAVSLGMMAATRLAESQQLCPKGLADQLATLLQAIGLPTATDLAPNEQLIDTMRLDKKVADNKIRFVLPQEMGRVTICDDISDEAVAAAWDTIRG
jgi:3-dehydroquinate synthase